MLLIEQLLTGTYQPETAKKISVLDFSNERTLFYLRQLRIMWLFDILCTKETAAAIIGALVSSITVLGGGAMLFLRAEKNRQRIEIFSKLATIPLWVQDQRSSELLSAIPIVFSRGSDDLVKIAYRNYQSSLQPFHTSVKVKTGSFSNNSMDADIYSDQTIYRRDLLRELAIASGWMSRKRAADFDFTSLSISLIPLNPTDQTITQNKPTCN